MASSLMSKQCDGACKDETEFLLKFIITSLTLTDKEAQDEFKDILIAITFDGNVIKIDDIQTKDDGEMKNVGRQLTLQITPEMFSKKLRKFPILIDLSRGCTELGTVIVEITDCFADAVKCEEFSSEVVNNEYKFIKDDSQNASMIMILQVSRPTDDESSKALNKLFSGYAKKQSEVGRKQQAAPVKSEFNDLSSSSSSTATCETDLCPNEDDSEEHHTTSLSVSSSTKSKSIHLKRSGSDSKIPCKSPSIRNFISAKKCLNPNGRICSECFEDLSVVPKYTPCPKCNYRKNLDRKPVLFKSEGTQIEEKQKIHDVIKSIFEEVFLETKDRLVTDWKRLKRGHKRLCEKPKKAVECNRRVLSQEKKVSMPRCSKLLEARKKSHKSKTDGLRKKHPGVIVGHKICQESGFLVPKNMGWLWNFEIAGKRGWRPGAVKKSVAKIMDYHLKTPKKPVTPEASPEPPTLRVQKKNGEYMIIMNPLRDATKQTDNISPIVFKVTKTEDAKKRSEARKILKIRGVGKCCDCSSIEKCCCMNECDKAQIKYELEQISKCLCINPTMNFVDMKDSSDSEIDMEFTPPSAVNIKNPCMKCKSVQVSYTGTQYENQVGNDCKNDDKCDDKPVPVTAERPRKLISKMMRERPIKKCYNPCAPTCETYQSCAPVDHRLTTNYNPINAQCPPQPPVCSDQYVPNHYAYAPHQHYQQAFCM